MKYAQQPGVLAGLLNRTKRFERGTIDWSLIRSRPGLSECTNGQSGLLDGDCRTTHLRLSLDRKAPMEQL